MIRVNLYLQAFCQLSFSSIRLLMHYRLLFLLLSKVYYSKAFKLDRVHLTYPYTYASSPMAKWVFLGSKTVDFGLDRDVIQVGYRDGSFKKSK